MENSDIPVVRQDAEGSTRPMTLSDCEAMAERLQAGEFAMYEKAKKDLYFVCETRKEELQTLWHSWCSISQVPFIYTRMKNACYKVTIDVNTAHGKITAGYQWKVLDFLQSGKIAGAPDFSKINLRTPLVFYVPSSRFVEIITGIVKICRPAVNR